MENKQFPQSKDDNNDIKVQLAFNYNIKLKMHEKLTLSELRNEISKNYFISEDEYEIFIGENKIDNFLTKNISLKTEEINLLNKEYENLINDLNNI